MRRYGSGGKPVMSDLRRLFHVAPSPRDRMILDSAGYVPSVMDPEVDAELGQVVVRKPWGYEYLAYANDRVALWILHINEGEATSLHCHPLKETELIVLEGEIDFSTSDQRAVLQAGQAVRIERGVFHQSRSNSVNCRVLEIERPNNKHDLLRLRDDYGRKDQGYEDSTHFDLVTENFNRISFSDAELGTLRKMVGGTGLYFFRGNGDRFVRSFSHLPESSFVAPLDVGDIESSHLLLLSEFRQKVEKFDETTEFEALVVHTDETEIPLAVALADQMASRVGDNIFLVESDQSMHLVDAFVRSERVRVTPISDPKTATFAALGSSLFDGSPSCAVLGGLESDLQARESIAEAIKSDLPLYLILGVPSRPTSWPWGQRMVASKFPSATGSCECEGPAERGAEITTMTVAEVLESGTTGLKPSLLYFSVENQTVMVDRRSALNESRERSSRAKASISGRQRKYLRDNLVEARHPILLVGRGVRISKSTDVLRALLREFDIPVVTSRSGLDVVSSDNPNFCGRAGAYGMRGANLALQNADLVMAVGTSLGPAMTGRSWKNFCRGSKVLMFNSDGVVMNRPSVAPEARFELEAMEALDLLGEALSDRRSLSTNIHEWFTACQWQHEHFDGDAGIKRYEPDRGSSYSIVSALSAVIDDYDVLAVDGGWMLHVATHALQTTERSRVIMSTSLESQGRAVALALGTVLAGRTQRAIVLTDELGLTRSLEALLHAAARDLPITVVVLNRHGESTVPAYKQLAYPGAQPFRSHAYPDPKDIAATVGCDYASFESDCFGAAELRELRAIRATSRGLLLVEIPLHDAQRLSPRPGFARFPDGHWEALPIEDLEPLLPIEVLEKQLHIPTTEVSKHARS